MLAFCSSEQQLQLRLQVCIGFCGEFRFQCTTTVSNRFRLDASGPTVVKLEIDRAFFSHGMTFLIHLHHLFVFVFVLFLPCVYFTSYIHKHVKYCEGGNIKIDQGEFRSGLHCSSTSRHCFHIFYCIYLLCMCIM